MQFAESPGQRAFQASNAMISHPAMIGDGSGSYSDPRTEIVGELRPETRELLQAIKDAAPAIRRLALSSAPFGVRSELIAHQIGQDDPSDGDGFLLTSLGEAVLEAIDPLSEEGQRLVAKRAEEALGDAPIAAEAASEEA